MGTRLRLAWGKIVEGPARSLKVWLLFCELQEEEKFAYLQQIQGGLLMYQQVQEVFSSCNVLSLEPTISRWVGSFTIDRA